MPSLFSKKKKKDESEAAHMMTPKASKYATVTTHPVQRSHAPRNPPPVYTEDAIPASHKAASYQRSLLEGDPNDKIDVPMIHTTHKLSMGDYLPWGSAMKTGKRTLISRSMTRDCYIKHYAKDEEGNYIGTEKPYPDHQLVFVPNKSSPNDILQQVSNAIVC